MIRKISLLLMLLVSTVTYSQSVQDNKYKYSVDLNNVSDDKLTIELITPKISNPAAKFMMPAMVPEHILYIILADSFPISRHSIISEASFPLQGRFEHLGNFQRGESLQNNVQSKADLRRQRRPKVFEPVGTDIDEGKVFLLTIRVSLDTLMVW
ncbi:MAG: hypothetical protein IPG02_17590 [Ignavibacteria bacterium]|nr:hypothetical protein [Ignavibacteria bacterium]